MRQPTKQKLIVVFIVLTFGMSTLAYIITSFTGGVPAQTEFKPLENFVVDGAINDVTENAYVQAGFTSMRFYYNTDALLSFIEQLPYMTRTNTDQQQLIVQKIPANETYVSIITANDAEEIRNVSRERIFTKLCEILTVTPLDCIALNING